MQHVTFEASEYLVSRLDEVSRLLSYGRDNVICEAIERFLSDMEKLTKLRRLIAQGEASGVSEAVYDKHFIPSIIREAQARVASGDTHTDPNVTGG